MVFGLVVLLVMLAWIVAPEAIAPYDPYKINMREQLQPPSSTHPFGTDEAGRDLLSRVIHGARYSVLLSMAIISIVAAIGTVIGIVSGLAGGRVDEVIMRVVEVFMSFPTYVLAMTIAASIGRNLQSATVALIVVWWPSYARMVRGLVLSLKESPFFEAARALGTAPWRMMTWHVLPHIWKELNARVTVDVGRVILAFAGLNFLGLGAQPPAPEWGLLVANSRQFFTPAWWYSTFPGLVIFMVVIAFTLLGDSLYETLEHRG
jgi:peptide/nickel transport system permease protein